MTSRATRKARREVLEGKKDRTKGGLTSDDIVLNKGRPVSKKKHEKHRREYAEDANHPLRLWQHAFSTIKARPEHAHLLSGKFVKAKNMMEVRSSTSTSCILRCEKSTNAYVKQRTKQSRILIASNLTCTHGGPR